MTSQSAVEAQIRTSRVKTERQEAIDKLRGWIKPGDVITTVLRHVSRSGMQRSISLTIPLDGEVFAIDYWAARATERKIDRDNGGIKIGGAGMDMGFALVYNLGRTLWPDGVGAKCDRCGLRPAHREDDGKLLPNTDANGDLYCYGPCSGWNRDTEPEGEFFGHTFRGRNGDRGPWESDGGYALKQRWL